MLQESKDLAEILMKLVAFSKYGTLSENIDVKIEEH